MYSIAHIKLYVFQATLVKVFLKHRNTVTIIILY